MNISLNINDTEVIYDADPSERLSVLLRSKKYYSVKCSCFRGICGSCTVLIDDVPVPSCIIPAAAAQHKKIITLEYFEKTPEYADILSGFHQAGVLLCGFCNAGVIFTIHSFLQKNQRPETKSAQAAARSCICSCTEKDTLTNSILIAGTIRRTRIENMKKNTSRRIHYNAR
ncbi:MAG: 2Fe-2S iron-sulfur cluster-binding protein [Bacteroides sp.]|nr:2Fe-2S iron-sulfur cluster-binding protein [Prevotella sp.]MCM1407239.1 2Fe-2S iron-sulfur cluster-binding protein [Treponema brennaborense]MCM1469727.1 2Fe-2S iron-sulfur cluster-binding protein [Bacteroides sp.]